VRFLGDGQIISIRGNVGRLETKSDFETVKINTKVVVYRQPFCLKDCSLRSTYIDKSFVMSENKTQPTNADVHEFLNAIEHQQRREDSFVVLELMQTLTNCKLVMWGDSIVGFGEYTYKYASGRTGDWFITGFSPRKQSLSLYLMYGFDKVQHLLDKLGKHKTGKGCLYINKLSDVDMHVLGQLITATVQAHQKGDK